MSKYPDQDKEIHKVNEDSFESVFKAHYGGLVNFSARITRSFVASEEIIQDVFADLWENKDRIKMDTTIRGYLYTATYNKTLNWLKHEKVMDKYNKLWYADNTSSHVHHEDEIVSIESSEMLRAALKRAVESLPENYRVVYCLHRVDGLSYTEIASVLGMSVKNVEYLLTRSLLSLRDSLKPFKDMIL